MGATIKESPVLDIFAEDHEIEHEWMLVQFSYASWTECTCGFKPQDQEEFDKHMKESGMEVDIPGERLENPYKTIPTYDVNPVYEGVNSSDIVAHTSMVAAVRDMIGIIKGEADITENAIYGWHIQYNDGSANPPFAEYVMDEDEKNDKKENN